eukprot:UN10007
MIPVRKNYSAKMLRTSTKPGKIGYIKKVKSNLSGLFLSNSSRNKKYDGAKSGMSSLAFSEIHVAIKNKSLEKLMEHESAPIILVCAILAFIAILYIIIAAFSSAFVINYDKVTTEPQLQYDK